MRLYANQTGQPAARPALSPAPPPSKALTAQVQFEALRLLTRAGISAPERCLPLLFQLSIALPLLGKITLVSPHRATAALAMQLLWLAFCDVGQPLQTPALLTNLLGNRAISKLVEMVVSPGSGSGSWGVEEADLDPAAWPHLPPGQRIQRMASEVLLMLLWRGCSSGRLAPLLDGVLPGGGTWLADRWTD
jgi:hypothetical protein